MIAAILKFLAAFPALAKFVAAIRAWYEDTYRQKADKVLADANAAVDDAIANAQLSIPFDVDKQPGIDKAPAVQIRSDERTGVHAERTESPQLLGAPSKNS